MLSEFIIFFIVNLCYENGFLTREEFLGCTSTTIDCVERYVYKNPNSMAFTVCFEEHADP